MAQPEARARADPTPPLTLAQTLALALALTLALTQALTLTLALALALALTLALTLALALALARSADEQIRALDLEQISRSSEVYRSFNSLGECMGASMGIQWEAELAAQAWGGGRQMAVVGGRWRGLLWEA